MSMTVRGTRAVITPSSTGTTAPAAPARATASKASAAERRARETSPAAQQQAQQAMALRAAAEVQDKTKAVVALDSLLRRAADFATKDPAQFKELGGARDLLLRARDVDPKLLTTEHGKKLMATLPEGLDAPPPGSKEAAEAAQRAAFQALRKKMLESTRASLGELGQSLGARPNVSAPERLAIEERLRSAKKLDPTLLTSGAGQALAARFPDFDKAGVAVDDAADPELARRADARANGGNGDNRVTADEYQRLSETLEGARQSGFGSRRDTEQGRAAAMAASALRSRRLESLSSNPRARAAGHRGPAPTPR